MFMWYSVVPMDEVVDNLIRKVLHEFAVIRETIVKIGESFGNYIATNEAEHETERDQQKNETKVAGEIWFPEAVEAKRSTEQEAQHTTQKIIAVAAWAAFIAALAYAVIAQLTLNQIREQTAEVYHQAEVENANASGQNAQLFRQLNIAERQTKAAQNSADAITQQMREDQRAWVTISMGKITWGVGKTISIPVTTTNVGKTAALRFIIDVMVIPYENSISASKALTFRYFGVPHFQDFSGYIAPNSHIDDVATYDAFDSDGKTIRTGVVSQDMAAKLLSGDEFLLIYAEAHYLDIFGVNHWTRLCNYAPSPTGLTYAAKCAIYSSVDKN